MLLFNKYLQIDKNEQINEWLEYLQMNSTQESWHRGFKV